MKKNMHPVLLRIGSLPINSYGLMLAISFLLGVKLAARRASKLGIPPDETTNLSIWIMAAAIIGSRAFYVATHMEQYAGDPIAAVAFWNGLYGLSMLGGVVLAMATGFTWIAKKKWPVWSFADAVIPSFALGIFITRIGCFLNGCCFGSETSCSLGVSFPQGSLPHSVFGSSTIHPAQLYSSAGGLLILAVLLTADRRGHFPGFIFTLFTGLYGATRFGMEEFRYFDHAPSGVFGYSHFAGRPGMTDNQLISLGMVIFSIGLGIWLYSRERKKLS
ncbi:MAG TPA: prolipoprotein diacylglyceryl transferase [Candidatus Sabulitectum sp.]|nr:prolipoprotein diacylglyceryl transferase [Candidatus Sabulitectum sp.]HPJ28246.1 prolipoprotein diacylglyceryl transferase [Candidatus Sabulitectum sp.]HPR22724.1 prolipoprotein diacylglyceryl transferase [Candidatus Sabulitectum sp.]